jgi:hypothetical protein
MRQLADTIVAAALLTACGSAAPSRQPATPTVAPTHVVRDLSAICCDGMLSFPRERQGTCSQHGGVREWRR